MRPSRSTGGAGDAHSSLGAMNRAGLAIQLAGEERMLTADWLIQSRLKEEIESSLPSHCARA
jgi:hypothetical protein